MYRNYFILNRLVVELSPLLRDAVIYSAFSQEKDRVVLSCKKKGDEFFIELSLNPGNPYFLFRESYSRAKKNTIEFFDDYLPQKIESVQIAVDDRIIKIKCGSADFYFAVRGKYTNLYMLTDSEILSFEKMVEDTADDLKNEFNSKIYSDEFNIPEITVQKDVDSVRSDFPVIGREIILEYKSRFPESDSTSLKEKLNQLLVEIEKNPVSVLVDNSQGEVHLSPSSYNIFSYDEKEEFESLVEALSYFIRKKFSLENSFGKKKIIVKYLERELTKLSQRINNVKARIDKGNREEDFNKIGNLLLINLKNIFPGSSSAEIEDIYNENQKIKIKLDPKFSAKKNADIYFDKAKNERIGYAKADEMYKKLKTEYERLKEYRRKADETDLPQDYDRLIKELKIKMDDNTSQKDELKSKFKHYVIDEKYNVFVGKDSQNNDLLTNKFAKQNDYWFHARSVSGSHVVLRVDNAKEAVPKNVLKKAAALAAFHSKAKTAGMVPVAYTFKKYVVKKKGMEAGKVALLKEEVFIVKPEIPQGCEYVTNE